MTQEPSVQDTQELAGATPQTKYVECGECFGTGEVVSGGVRYGGSRARCDGEGGYEIEIKPGIAAVPPPATSSAMEALAQRFTVAKKLDPIAFEQPYTRDGDADAPCDPWVVRRKLALQQAADILAALQAGTGVAVKATHKVEHEEQPGFTYYECPECGFDCIHPADYEPRSTACPLCAGDSGHDVGMRSRPARSTDKPEGKDARPAAPVQQAGVESELVEPVAQVAWFTSSHVEMNWIAKQPPVVGQPLYSAASLSKLHQRIAGLELECDEWRRKAEAQYDENVNRIAAEGAAILRAEAAEAALKASDAKLAEAVEVLKPFAEAVQKADEHAANRGFAPSFDEYACEWEFTFGQLRRARSFTSSIQDRALLRSSTEEER